MFTPPTKKDFFLYLNENPVKEGHNSFGNRCNTGHFDLDVDRGAKSEIFITINFHNKTADVLYSLNEKFLGKNYLI